MVQSGARVAAIAGCWLFELNYFIAATLPHLEGSAETGPSILAGTPTIAAFQSRLLAPALQWSLEQAGAPRNYAFVAAAAILLGAFNLLFLVGARAMEARRAALLYAATIAAWALLFDPGNVFLWDLVDLVVFTGLAFVALGALPEWSLLALFAVALPNRESAAFLGLWVASTAWERRSLSRAVLGMAMILIAGIYMVAARKALLLSTELAGDIGGGTFLALPANLEAIAELTSWPMRAPLLGGLTCAAGVLAWLVIEGRERLLALYMLACAGGSCLFGLWFESRIFVFLAPLVGALAVKRLLPPSRPIVAGERDRR